MNIFVVLIDTRQMLFGKNDTKQIEMEKWNSNETKINIMNKLEKLDKDELMKVYEFVKTLA